jgi:hypothetical protein
LNIVLWLFYGIFGVSQLIGMESGGGSSEEISGRVRDWCQSRAPDEPMRRALAQAADTAHRAQRKYDKVGYQLRYLNPSFFFILLTHLCISYVTPHNISLFESPYFYLLIFIKAILCKDIFCDMQIATFVY